MRKPTPKEIDDLEILVDQIGLAGLYHALASIAYGKASHVEESYSDRKLSAAWKKVARTFDSLITKERPEGF